MWQADLKKTLAYRIALAAECAQPDTANQDAEGLAAEGFGELPEAHPSQADMLLPHRVILPYQVSLKALLHLARVGGWLEVGLCCCSKLRMKEGEGEEQRCS